MKKMKLEEGSVILSKDKLEKKKDELIYVKVTPEMKSDLDKLCNKLGVKNRSRAKIIRALISEALLKVKVVA